MNTLSLVIPCYNEAARLSKSAFLEALVNWPWVSFCFVDDGSTDSTAELLAHLTRLSPSVHALYLPRNIGKAEAVRTGIRYLCENACSDFVGFWDADLATPLYEIPRFVQCFEADEKVKAVIGSRWPHLGADIQRSPGRGFASIAFKMVVRRILKAPVWDTQCGAKIFSREIADEIFASPFSTRWIFDIEILSRLGCDRLRTQVQELPVSSWRDVPGSKIGIGSSVTILRELWILAKTLKKVDVSK